MPTGRRRDEIVTPLPGHNNPVEHARERRRAASCIGKGARLDAPFGPGGSWSITSPRRAHPPGDRRQPVTGDETLRLPSAWASATECLYVSDARSAALDSGPGMRRSSHRDHAGDLSAPSTLAGADFTSRTPRKMLGIVRRALADARRFAFAASALYVCRPLGRGDQPDEGRCAITDPRVPVAALSILKPRKADFSVDSEVTRRQVRRVPPATQQQGASFPRTASASCSSTSTAWGGGRDVDPRQRFRKVIKIHDSLPQTDLRVVARWPGIPLPATRR